MKTKLDVLSLNCIEQISAVRTHTIHAIRIYQERIRQILNDPTREAVWLQQDPEGLFDMDHVIAEYHLDSDAFKPLQEGVSELLKEVEKKKGAIHQLLESAMETIQADQTVLKPSSSKRKETTDDTSHIAAKKKVRVGVAERPVANGRTVQ